VASILILATRYDSITRRTHNWARNLERTLVSSVSKHHIASYYGTSVSATLLSSAPSADYVLFFGHGEPDRLIAQRGRLSLGSGPTLVDTTTVKMLGGTSVYAVCCQAGILLGPAHSKVSSHAEFIGYRAPFGFSYPNAGDFESVVSQSALALINGNRAQQIHAGLKQEWFKLSDDFLNGSKQHHKDAFLAGYAAATNSLFVSISP
jgi:hypothetical protein